MPRDGMDLERIARGLTAAVNPEVAKRITSLIKDTIEPLLEQFNPDYGYDALAGAIGRGMSEGSMSFPARPAVFDTENLNGTILVKITLDPPVSGSGKDIAGTATTAKLECGFYFKTPAKDPETGKTSGKYMMARDAGKAEITFDGGGSPEFDDDGELVDLVEAMEAVAEAVVDSPPPGAKSMTRDPAERKRTHEQNKAAKKLLEEKRREEEQQRKFREQREADEAVYGSPEAFAAYLGEQEQDDFGPADLQKVLQTMFKDKLTQAAMQVKVKDDLERLGLRFNPRKNRLSAVRGPSEVADRLRAIAARIERSERPDRRLVAADVQLLLRDLEVAAPAG